MTGPSLRLAMQQAAPDQPAAPFLASVLERIIARTPVTDPEHAALVAALPFVAALADSRPGHIAGWMIHRTDGSFVTMCRTRAAMERLVGDGADGWTAVPVTAVMDDASDMLPDALAPVADQWYAMCERAPHIDHKLKITGDLARAIIETITGRAV